MTESLQAQLVFLKRLILFVSATARIPRSDVDKQVPVCNVRDFKEFSTSREDHRPHPVTDVTDESRLSAVAAVASENVNTEGAIVNAEPTDGGNVPLPDCGRAPDPPGLAGHDTAELNSIDV